MVILLDIDGVMIPASSWKNPALLADGFSDFSPKSVTSLNNILFTTGASIVLTTSHKDKYTVPVWEEIFVKRGIEATLSKLTTSSVTTTRKAEVLRWIELHANKDSFVIIDDDKSLNDLPSEFKKNLILTSPLIGLNEELANQAIIILQQSAAKLTLHQVSTSIANKESGVLL